MKNYENLIGLTGAATAYLAQPGGLNKPQTLLFLFVAYWLTISVVWIIEDRIKRIRRRMIAKQCREYHKSIGYSKPLSDVVVNLDNYMQFKTVSTQTGACIGKNTVRVSKWREA